MYEIPKRRAVRRGITRDEAEAKRAEDELLDWLIDAIETNPDVQAAIQRVKTSGPKPRASRPTTPQTLRRGRGR